MVDRPHNDMQCKRVKALSVSSHGTPTQKYGMSLAKRDRTITFYPRQVNTLRRSPSQEGRYSIYLSQGIEG